MFGAPTPSKVMVAKSSETMYEPASLENLMEEVASLESTSREQISTSTVDPIAAWKQDFSCKLHSVQFVVQKAIEDDNENKVKHWAKAYDTKINQLAAEWKKCSKVEDDSKHM